VIEPTDNKSPIAGGEASRREFITAAGAAAMAAAAVTSPQAAVASHMPTTAAGMKRVIGANDRIHVGHIGPHWNGQGGVHTRYILQHKEDWNIEYAAIADIYTVHLAHAQQHIGLPDNRAFIDYRQMLDKVPEIDVVWVTTPEHWHFAHATAAMEMGKHVYCEKPLCKGVDEALKMHETALRTGVVFQMGVQASSDPTYKYIGDQIATGKYGPIVWSQGSYCRNSTDGEWNYYPLDAEATPENTHWKVFEEPCHHKHEFDKQRFFRWRKFWSYSAGIAGDLWPHVLTPIMIAMGKLEYPRRVVSTGDLLIQKDREVPDTVHQIIEYPSGFTMILAGSTTNDHGLTPTIRTHLATIEFAMFGGGQVHIMPQGIAADQLDEVNLHVPGAMESIEKHEHNFLECVRNPKLVPNCNIDIATKVQVALSMGEMAYRQNREMLFDAEKMRLI
jgi:predicted dehydrogenase